MKDWIVKAWLKTVSILSRELRANSSPVQSALSLALGILIGFSPFYGLHTVMVIPLAYLLRLNRPLALLATCLTALPVVPLWIAAGIFTGKLVMPIESAKQLVVKCSHFLPLQWFEGATASFASFARHILPKNLVAKMLSESDHNFLAGFVQWFVGCSALAVAGAVATFVIAYPVLLYINAARKKREKPESAGQ